ncbi:LytR/AlgR family response regulator transcription factor [Litoribacter populi]|uniref:LytR/AlgR family response regulator transcription factor n=1 Tax=Litoribacter populi TaxID=2598460 RepID=UPI0011806B1C|nr:LytTR family DNA-binding domain-containing protein [Litoribacter populi]
MRVLIIEDERPAANRLKQLLKEMLPDAEIFGHMDSIETAMEWLNYHPAPDLIFCDIQLADGQSFEIFEKVKIESPIIFTTAFDQYAIKAFKLNSVDYLLKPIDPKELDQALSKFKSLKMVPTLDAGLLKSILQQNEKTYKSRFMVRYGETIQSIETNDAAYFFSQEKMVFLQTRLGRKYVLDYTLDQLEEMLDPKRFFRLNRKYLAAVDVIDGIYTYSNSRLKIKLQKCEDNDILVSREKVGMFKDWLDQ